MQPETLTVPDHVPAHLVYDYDRFATPALYETPQFSLARKLREEAPPIFFAPRQQVWVVSRAAFVADMLTRHDLFSSDPDICLWRNDMPIRVLPTAYDPPDHADARKIVTPLFTPKSVAAMEPEIRALSREMIADVLDEGGCEFVSAIGKRFPVTVFLKMADAPLEDRLALIDMVETYLRSPDRAVALAGAQALTDHLAKLVEARKTNLGTDLISRILMADMGGRSLSDAEVIGAVWFMFLAGLDTVAAALSFTMRFLADNPDHYAQLVADPPIIRDAVEELLRVNGVAMPERGVRDDVVYEGVQFRKHDHILLLSSLSGLDPAEMDEPERVNFHRDVNRHAVFGNGPHRCLGSHLARLELRIFLEEWVRYVPEFRRVRDTKLEIIGGTVWIPAALPLEWDRPAQTLARQAA